MERIEIDARYGFWNAQLEKLGRDDPLDVLAATPSRLLELARDRSDAAWRRPEAPGKWSPLRIAGHLLDIEWVFGFRVRAVLYDDRPLLRGMDQDAWSAGQAGHDASPKERAASFAGVRDANLRLYLRLSPAERARSGRHEDAGIDLSVDLLLRIQAGHDRWHLERLERLLGD